MKKTVPVAVYRNGIRYVVAEAMVEVPDDTPNLHNMEVDITEPQLTMIKTGSDGVGHYSLKEK